MSETAITIDGNNNVSNLILGSTSGSINSREQEPNLNVLNKLNDLDISINELFHINRTTAAAINSIEGQIVEHTVQLSNLEGTGSAPAGLPQTIESCAPLFNYVSDGMRASGKYDAVVIDGVTYYLPRNTSSLKGLVGKLKVGTFSGDMQENIVRLGEIPLHFAGTYTCKADWYEAMGTMMHRVHVQNQRVVVSEHSTTDASVDDVISVKSYHVANGGVRSAVADDDILVLCEEPSAGDGDVKEAFMRSTQTHLMSANGQELLANFLMNANMVNVQESVEEFVSALNSTVTSEVSITQAPEKAKSSHMAALQKGMLMSDQSVKILVFDNQNKTCTMHTLLNVVDDRTYSTALQSAIEALDVARVDFADPLSIEEAKKFQSVRKLIPHVCAKSVLSSASAEASAVLLSRDLSKVDSVALAIRRKQAALNYVTARARLTGYQTLLETMEAEMVTDYTNELALLMLHNTALGKPAALAPQLPAFKLRSWWDEYKINIGTNDLLQGPHSTVAAKITSTSAINVLPSSASDMLFPGVSATTAAGANVVVMPLGDKVVCIDADTSAVKWQHSAATLFSIMGTRQAHMAAHPLVLQLGAFFAPLLRSKPRIVASRNMVILACNSYSLPFVGGFDLDTGATIFEIDADEENVGPGFGNAWDPAALINEAHTALRVTPVFATEDGEDYLYCSLARGVEYYMKNLFSKEDQSKPGHLAFCGAVAKVKLLPSGGAERVWTCPTMPEPIIGTPGEKVPAGCLRPGLTSVIATTELQVDMPLSGVTGATIGAASRKIYVPSRYAEGDGVRQDIGWVVDLSTTATLEAATTYSATLFDRADSSAYVDADVGVLVRTFTGAQLAGQTGAFDDSSGTPVEYILRVTMQVEVTTDFEFVDADWSRSIAYSLNYFGANPWQDGVVLSEDHITVGVGNATKQPVDESMALDSVNTNIQALSGRLAAGEITIEQYESLSFAQRTDLLSPRGKRAFLSSLMTLDRKTGAPHQRVSTTAWDMWTVADVGGLGSFFGMPAVLGQPFAKPYIVPFGPDADATGPVAMDSGYMGCGTKGGLAIITKVASMPMATALVAGDVTMTKGFATLQSPPDTKKVLVGYAGFLGGVNFGVATNGKSLFLNLANNSEPTWSFPGLPVQQLPKWVRKDGNLIEHGDSYMVAVDTSGEVVWDALTGRVGSAQSSVHEGGVIVASGNGHLVFDTTSGAEIARLVHTTPNACKAPPTIATNNVAFAPHDTTDGVVTWNLSI